jgi:hypothetical protein
VWRGGGIACFMKKSKVPFIVDVYQ